MPFILLILIFFLHGTIYFWFPEAVRDESSLFKLIKYLVIILAFIVTLNKNNVKLIYAIPIILTLLPLSIIAHNFSIDITALKYLIPLVSVIILYKPLMLVRNKTKFKIVFTTYIVGVVFGFIEFNDDSLSLSPYSTGLWGARISSIFVNPNNFGITMFFLLLYLTNFTIKKNFIIFLWILFIPVALLSFSKTSIFLAVTYIVLKFAPIMLPVSSLMLLVAANNSNINFENINLPSLIARFDYNNSFIELLSENPIFPFFNKTQYTDNIFFNVYGHFGFIGFFILIILYFFLLILLLLNNRRNQALVLFLFLVAEFTTNILYLWPIGYMHWGFILYCFGFMEKSKFNSNISYKAP